jgi:hypothetical protein
MWSKERENPTLCKLDVFYYNAEWDIRFHTHVLYALSSLLSDHCPLLLADDSGLKRPRSFKFENFCIRLPGFNYVVKKAWDTPSTHTDPCQIIFHKLRETGKCLHKWGKGIYSSTKVLLHVALLVILHFDMVQEDRKLFSEELNLLDRLKRKVIALAVVERARKKQCA